MDDGDGTGGWPLGKRMAGGLSLLMVGAVLWPIVENWRTEPKDSFPLSYFPMFSVKRGKEMRLAYLVGYDAQGRRYPIPYRYAGAGGLNQVRRQLNAIVRTGRAEDLCRRVAAALAGEPVGPLAEVVTVQVVTGRFCFDDYFFGNKEPLAEVVHATWTTKGARP